MILFVIAPISNAICLRIAIQRDYRRNVNDFKGYPPIGWYSNPDDPLSSDHRAWHHDRHVNLPETPLPSHLGKANHQYPCAQYISRASLNLH